MGDQAAPGRGPEGAGGVDAFPMPSAGRGAPPVVSVGLPGPGGLVMPPPPPGSAAFGVPPPLPHNYVEEQVVRQVEFYLGEENLEKDFFLLQRMDSARWVSLSVIVSFNRVQRLGVTDPAALAHILQARSSLLEVDMERLAVRAKTSQPAHQTSTLTLFGISVTDTAQELRDMLSAIQDFPPILAMTPEAPETWHIAFDGEHGAQLALDLVKDKTFRDTPIKGQARVDAPPAAAQSPSPQATGLPPNGVQSPLHPQMHVPAFYPGPDGHFAAPYGAMYGPYPAIGQFPPVPARPYVPGAPMQPSYFPAYYQPYPAPGQQPPLGVPPFDHGAQLGTGYRGARGRGARGRSMSRENSGTSAPSGQSAVQSAPGSGLSDKLQGPSSVPSVAGQGAQPQPPIGKSAPGARTPQRSPSPPSAPTRSSGYATNTNALTTRINGNSGSGYGRGENGARGSNSSTASGISSVGHLGGSSSRKSKRGGRQGGRGEGAQRDDSGQGGSKARGSNRPHVNLSAQNFPPLAGQDGTTVTESRPETNTGTPVATKETSTSVPDEDVPKSESAPEVQESEGDVMANGVMKRDEGRAVDAPASPVPGSPGGVQMSYAAILRQKAPPTPLPVVAQTSVEENQQPSTKTVPVIEVADVSAEQMSAASTPQPQGPKSEAGDANIGHSKATNSVWANKPKAVLEATPTANSPLEELSTESRRPTTSADAKGGAGNAGGENVRNGAGTPPPNGSVSMGATSSAGPWTDKDATVERLAGSTKEMSL